MANDAHMVIVGAGLAGARASAELREAGFAGAITLIGGEPHAPYDRPPLSRKRCCSRKNRRMIARSLAIPSLPIMRLLEACSPCGGDRSRGSSGCRG